MTHLYLKCRIGLAIPMSAVLLFCHDSIAEPENGSAADYVSKNSAFTLMKNVDERDTGDTSSIRSNVVVIDKNNVKNTRSIHVREKEYDDVTRSITFISEPAKLRGTGFLSYDWVDLAKENESWIFLPALAKVTRLSTSNRADYFLGSDFSYGDLEGLEVQDFKYTYADEQLSADGLINVIAIPEHNKEQDIIDKYGYRKISYWVDHKRMMVIRAQYWLEDSGWIKYYKASDIQDYSGVWIAKQEQIVLTLQNQKVHSTVMTIDSVVINKPMPDALFSTYSLEKNFTK